MPTRITDRLLPKTLQSVNCEEIHSGRLQMPPTERPLSS